MPVPRDTATSTPAGTTGGGVQTAGGMLTRNQAVFVSEVARLTGLDEHVVAAWTLAEESGGFARARERQGNHNWLNIAYFDSGPGQITRDAVWKDPRTAARATAQFLQGKKYGASDGIKKILNTAGKSPADQITAIASSGWASSGYNAGNNLRSLYRQVTGKPISAGSTTSSDSSSDSGGIFTPLLNGAVKAMLWVALILTGAVLIALGISRTLGAARKSP